VRAFESGAARTEAVREPRTIAAGLRVPQPFADTWLLRVLRESGGAAVSVAEADLARAAIAVARDEGSFVSPESAAAFAALPALVESGRIGRSDEVLVVETGGGLLDPAAWSEFLEDDSVAPP
jgi:threonine synthase